MCVCLCVCYNYLIFCLQNNFFKCSYINISSNSLFTCVQYNGHVSNLMRIILPENYNDIWLN